MAISASTRTKINRNKTKEKSPIGIIKNEIKGSKCKIQKSQRTLKPYWEININNPMTPTENNIDICVRVIVNAILGKIKIKGNHNRITLIEKRKTTGWNNTTNKNDKNDKIESKNINIMARGKIKRESLREAKASRKILMIYNLKMRWKI